MDDQISSADGLSVSAITALSNVKEIQERTGNHGHILILFLMVIFVFFIVGLSVYNFNGLVPQHDIQVINAIKNSARIDK